MAWTKDMKYEEEEKIMWLSVIRKWQALVLCWPESCTWLMGGPPSLLAALFNLSLGS